MRVGLFDFSTSTVVEVENKSSFYHQLSRRAVLVNNIKRDSDCKSNVNPLGALLAQYGANVMGETSRAWGRSEVETN